MWARTGSEPSNATRQERESSAARASGDVRSTQRSKAKFGAPLTVARYLSMAASHRIGFWRNAIGGMRTQCTPRYIVWSTFPMSPMSWKSGSQPANTVSDERRMASLTASSFAMRLPWVTTTPLGRPVDPEVYWRNARSSGRGAAPSHSFDAPSASSRQSHVGPGRASESAGRSATDSARPVRIAATPASRPIAASPVTGRRARGTTAGTATTPA